MRLIHLAEFNHFDKDNHSGTPYWMSKSLSNSGVAIHDFNISISDKLMQPLDEMYFQLQKWLLKIFKKEHLSADYFSKRAEYIAETINPRLNSLSADAILTSITPLSAAYLESKNPIIYWTDATYSNLISTYPDFRNHHSNTMWDAHFITKACLENASLLLFSTNWAARSAIETYGISKKKVKVVPYGANLSITHDYDAVKQMISNRSSKSIKLLFIGKDWYRKNGDMVLAVAHELHQAGHAVELTIIGCTPEINLPSYVTCLGLLSKNNVTDVFLLQQLYEAAHFLFVPSIAEAFGIVFCEANAFAVPCITTHIGGIPEVVKDDLNGMTFSLEATPKDYCDYIVDLMNNRQKYEELALSSYNEYITRLNWQHSAREAKRLIGEIL